ncbi:MAG TPA: response regulator [Casimicrobiaceae bacterium]|nr:response regulator [Casimicrobiaceae bacterium]
MSRLRVGLVEDSERVRARLAEALAEIPNVEVAFAADTEGDAVRLLASERWDVLILDLQLRVGTGLGVLKAMQGLLAGDSHVTMVLTNYVFRQYRDRALALGARYFFDKSHDIPAMRQVLADLAAATA